MNAARSTSSSIRVLTVEGLGYFHLKIMSYDRIHQSLASQYIADLALRFTLYAHHGWNGMVIE